MLMSIGVLGCIVLQSLSKSNRSLSSLPRRQGHLLKFQEVPWLVTAEIPVFHHTSAAAKFLDVCEVSNSSLGRARICCEPLLFHDSVSIHPAGWLSNSSATQVYF